MNEQQFFTEIGAIAYCSNFRELKKVYGFARAVRAYSSRCRYSVRLWILRESAIILTLIDNYEKIPDKTPTKLIVSIFKRFAFLRTMLAKSVQKIQNSFIKNL